jgi:hypothetical protein
MRHKYSKDYVWPPLVPHEWREPWGKYSPRWLLESATKTLEERHTTKNNPLFLQFYKYLSWVKPVHPDLFERVEVCRRKMFSFFDPNESIKEVDEDLNFLKQLVTDIIEWEDESEEYRLRILFYRLEKVFKLLPPEVLSSFQEEQSSVVQPLEQTQSSVPEKE